jgi:photosystem II stability/assembly factor-like uncharacterized protein
MKKLFTFFMAFWLFHAVSFAQIHFDLNASEGPYQELTEQENQFLTTYSELNRWKQFHQTQLSMLNQTAAVFSPTWENLGPNSIDTLSGRMLCLTFHPDSSDVLYAGAGAGGLWRSDNAGASWRALTDELPSMRVSAVAVNPNNTREILIGTGIGQVPSISLQPGVGVLKSVDGGNNWQMTSFSFALSQNVSTYKIVYDPFDQDRVYLAATNGFYISTNGGDTWQQILTNRIYDIELHPTQAGTMYIGTQSVGVQRSTNSGMNWSTLTTGIPNGSQVFRTDIAICDSTPNILLAKLINNNTFNDGGLYRSTNDGNSWTQIQNAPAVACQPSNPSACSGWLFNTVGIAPDDPDKMYIGGVQFWYSENGGNSWTWKDYASNGSGGGNKNLVYVDHWDIDFDPNVAGRLYVCCDGGVIRSDDYGRTWNRMSKDLVNAMLYNIAVDPKNPDFMIGGFHDHGLQRLQGNNGNLTWTRWSLGDGIQVLIDTANPGVIYGNIHTGAIYKSTTYGNGLTSSILATNGITEGGNFISPLIMNPLNTKVLYTASTAKIYKTINAAVSWTAVANFPNVQTMELSEFNPHVVYAHAFNASSWQLYRSDNAGQNWTSLTDPSIPSWGVTALESDPHQPGRVYATRNSTFPNRDHVKVSQDNGKTWTDITNNLPDIKVNDILVSPYHEKHLFLATDLGIYFSDDGGNNWCPFNNNLPRIYCRDLQISWGDSTLRVATLGRGVWKTSLHALMMNTALDEVIMEDPIQVTMSPNPTSGSFEINMNAILPTTWEISLYDAQGKWVMDLGKSDQKTLHFYQKIQIPAQFGNGTYFVQIRSNHHFVSRKLVIL